MTEQAPGNGRAKFQQLLTQKPRKVAAGTAGVRLGFTTQSPDRLPVLAEAVLPGLDLTGWAVENAAVISEALDRHGAILLRGFAVDSVEDFQRFVRRHIDNLVGYQERSTPRQSVAEDVFTSTEYPADQTIVLHNEMSYSHEWPLRLAFHCRQAAETGGATPIGDSREVYRLIEPDLRAEFERRGVMYTRTFGGGVDLPWTDAFQTTDRARVEAYCREAGISFEWFDGDGLMTRQVRAATATHPGTGERVWFNSAHMFHVAGHEPQVRDSLRTLFGDRLPRHALFGDGTPIPDDAITAICDVYRRVGVAVPWRVGDVLVVDNMLACHGREPYTGARQILVAMGEPTR